MEIRPDRLKVAAARTLGKIYGGYLVVLNNFRRSSASTDYMQHELWILRYNILLKITVPEAWHDARPLATGEEAPRRPLGARPQEAEEAEEAGGVWTRRSIDELPLLLSGSEGGLNT
ncbi:hypothetical protein EYF80_060059 [Liparis tanakae]|uniref:Uncharacterized protein n=1 Tax=Liparis tanakae TaxID=230148 RepID=A0A4Z2EN24_9TELE|nr:hypothetical protein EYF80_060059 [Liparis tanakae]